MKIFTLCRPYLLSHKYTLTAYVLIILISTAIAVFTPYIIGGFIDSLVEGADVHVILRFCFIFGGLSLVRIIKGYIIAILNIKMQTKMGYSLNRDTIRHIQSLSLSYANKQDNAYLNQRVNHDSNSLIGFCITVLQSVITNAIILIATLAILFTMNWVVALLMMVFLMVYAMSYFAFKKPLYNAGLAFREAQAGFFSKLFEQLKYIRLIKINSIQPEMNRRADDSFVDFNNATVRNQKVNYLYTGLDGIISTIAQVVLFVVGGLQILAGNFTIGMFTVFTSYFNMMMGASRYFFTMGAAYQSTLVAYDRIKEIFGHVPENNGAEAINNIHEIELRNVNFSYDNSKRILTDFNEKFTKGNIYAIVGANGVGKSTLISLLMGLYIDEYDGHVTYNGMDIHNINIVTARKNLMGFAEQEPSLISDSIGYNLIYSDNPRLDEYVETLNMKDFISKHTLDFKINETNTNISGGEKQKISILKVLCKNPAVMIFDEPTSALDTQTTERFINHLQGIKKDKIIIVITHDEAVKRRCDKVVII